MASDSFTHCSHRSLATFACVLSYGVCSTLCIHTCTSSSPPAIKGLYLVAVLVVSDISDVTLGLTLGF